MTRSTDLHNYTVPTTGDNDYDTTFDSWFTDVDVDIPIRDVESNLSNYTPKSGAKFEATDTGAIYIGNGSSWNKASRDVDSVTANSVNTNNQTINQSFTDPSGKSHTAELADLADTLSTSDVDSTNWSDYELQKNGSDGSGVINFKT